MLLETLFLPRSIARFGSPLSAFYPPIPRPAEPLRAALFPASYNDRRQTDRSHRSPRNPGRSQSLFAARGCLRNSTTLSEREKSPFHWLQQVLAKPRSTAFAGAPSGGQEI